MYRLSTNIRKHTPTPLVSVDENDKETIVLLSPLKKAEGEKLLQDIANFLNKKS